MGFAPLRCATSAARLSRGMTSTPSTSAASRASEAGMKTVLKPSSLATTTMGKMPFVCLSPPSSDSSPRNSEDSGIAATCPELRSTATAIGKS